ncbi:hypothetical protein D9615_010399 [Tricholomella constricta]|uniref:G domain-containing protein n=1 Tax=Tricholomella constricta TaxID=117010 RepID=A0A8H5GPU7_9AGAR|nr:hypothetical protein D9615_010399 [Tricholomella constricta]
MIFMTPVSSLPPSAQENAPLRPTTADILYACPRFRILVIGRTGVGKSALINEAFGVSEGSVEHDKRGKADIDKEILSRANDRFVLHDSLGFEPGEGANLDTVLAFIKGRNRMREVKDKLHAIWLCFEIPVAGSRVVEKGTELLLKEKMEGRLGDIPIIAVFTKYDKLVAKVRIPDLQAKGPGSASTNKPSAEHVAKTADAVLQELCIAPFQECLNNIQPALSHASVNNTQKVLHVIVSTKPKYRSTLDNLIQLTQNLVIDYFNEAGIVVGIAQRLNRDVKTTTSIKVGKGKYWMSLGTTLDFPGKTFEECLRVLHDDIVNVWSFMDDYQYLYCQEFRKIIYKFVDIRPKPEGDSYANGAFPAAPIVLPIAAAMVLAAWLHDVYTASREALQRLMLYIIQLTLIMQIIFWLCDMQESGHQKPLTRRIIKPACEIYDETPQSNQLRLEIEKYARGANLLNRKTTFERTEQLINKFRISPEAEEEQKAPVEKDNFFLADGEGW